MHYSPKTNIGFRRRLRSAIVPQVILLASIALFGTTAIFAQVSGTGQVEGTITDPAGGVVPAVKVTATNTATGATQSTTSTSAGLYVLNALQPGVYTIEFTAPGFGSVRQEKIKVEPIETVGLNIGLKVGGTSTEMVVTSPPAPLDTENGTTDTVLPTETYDALPSIQNGGPKSPLAFLNLLPGVNANTFLGVPNINGGAEATSAFYLNGLPYTSPELQGDPRNITGALSVETVSEIQTITSGIPASYTGQGVVNLVSKSGTNKFHGDVYENIRNTALDSAGPWSNGVVGIDHQNEYGFSIGGPVLKDKLFFFFNLNRYALNQVSTPGQYSLPTAAERTGDFSALLNPAITGAAGPIYIYDPATTTCDASGICTRQPFPGNIIPAGRISPISSALSAALPAPQNGSLTNNYLGVYPNQTTQNNYTGKVDYKINDRHSVYALFSEGTNAPTGTPNTGGVQIPLPYGSSQITKQTITVAQLGETWIVRQNLINVFGAQYNRFAIPTTNPTDSGNYATKAGLTGLPAGEPQEAFPPINFAGGSNLPTNWQSGSPHSYSDLIDEYTFQDNVQWTKGKHSVTTGFNWQTQQQNYVQPSKDNYFNFSNNETAGFLPTGALDHSSSNTYASFLLGLVDSASVQDAGSAPAFYGRYHSFAAYGQDDWKVTPKVTLNLGLRWNVAFPVTEKYNHMSWFNPDLPNPAVDGFHGALQFAGDGTDSCHCSTRIQTHWAGGLEPRLGMAYALNSKTAVRGSFSIVHFLGAALGGSDQVFGTGQTGYSASPSFSSPDNGITPAFNWNSGFPAYQHPPFFDPTLGAGYNTASPNSGGGSASYDRPTTAGIQPYSENWNLTLSRALSPSVVWELTYAGSETHHISICCGFGIYSNALNSRYWPLGDTLLNSEATPANVAAADAIIPGIALPYPDFKGSIGQALRPFPQYGGTGDSYANFGEASYNALQTKVSKRLSNGLYLLASYVWSKNMDTPTNTIPWLSCCETGDGYRDPYNLKIDRSISYEDNPNAIKALVVYTLPIGRGQKFNVSQPWLNSVIGGWQLAADASYIDGGPIGSFGANCDTPINGYCYADYNPNFHGKFRLNGKPGTGPDVNGTAYLNAAAFQDPATFTRGNTPRSLAFGVRQPWSKNEDLVVSKEFPIWERANFKFKADIFNLFNRGEYAGYDTNIHDANFGHIGGVSNTPRIIQLEGYLRF